MSLNVSLEEVLRPVGETESPVVGMQIEDWDENVKSISQSIVDMGYAVQVLGRGEFSAESLVTYRYGGEGEEIPVLEYTEGEISVLTPEGERVSLESHLGSLGHG